MNQLVREDNVGGETVVYTYDNGGNILTKQKYAYTPKGETPTELLNTVTYGYSNGEWKDLLTAFDGDTLTYDEVGNPLNYRDGMTMTWSDGRRLGSVTSADGETYSYTYNESGIRTKKTVNGGTTEYTLNGTNIISETLSTGEKLYFFYDEKGSPVAFNYYAANSDTRTTYYLVKNIQGDVISLVNSYGQTVATYAYDTWGKLISITGTLADTIGEINPYRYRSYLYDTETGFYYLNSRYYDPVTGRFVNGDNQIAGVGNNVLGYNLFAYCFNNPVNMNDETGDWPKWIGKAIAVVAVAAIVVAAVAVTVSTFGAGSIAGVAAITAAVAIAAGATEVVALQIKKSKKISQNTGEKTVSNINRSDGNISGSDTESNAQKNNEQIAADVIESLFDNGLQIVGITPITKSGSIGINHVLNKQISETFGETATLKATLSEPGGKFVSYAWTAYACYNATISIFSADPVQRAEKRGYTLK